MYESYRLDYEKYYRDGLETARWLVAHLNQHTDLRDKTFLDWGCGPARVIRHLPDILIGQNCRFAAADYNAASIAWCRRHFTDITFVVNNLNPPLSFAGESFDIVYGLSVLTHLPENLHVDWLPELNRVLKKDGLLFLTTHGRSCRLKLGTAERQEFDSGRLVVRGQVKAGHRTFTAYQPEAFMIQLLSGFTIIAYLEGGERESGPPEQDVWIARKN